jgi:acetyl-CoA C-acetyltransferase
MDERTPILIGAGQITQRDVDPATALEPAELMRVAALRAAEDAGITAAALASVDVLAVVNILSWTYANAPRLLAERLDARPRAELYSTIGGNTPQSLVNDLAARVAAGEVELALLAGAEAMHSLTRARRAGVALAWQGGTAAPPDIVGDPRPGTTDHEMRHGFVLPVHIYPLFENALRARTGSAPAAHLHRLGELYARLSRVAADNPYAWFATARSADEIATVDERNRIIAFPYPKLMNAIIDVDQGAALLLTSVGKARALGVPEERWIFLQGCGDAHDLWFVSERRDYASSPAIAAAGAQALEMAGVSIADVDVFDLYSCFPSAVQLGRDALGIAADDPRPLSVTGGLAAFGGPGSNYSMHAIASMMHRLRATRGQRGLVSALGWYVTKHAIGIYGSAPGPLPWRPPARAERLQAELDAMPHPTLSERPDGAAVIETYTVVHDRGGAPQHGLVIGRLDDGTRFLATLEGDRAALESVERAEGVGRRGRVRAGDDGVNRFSLA